MSSVTVVLDDGSTYTGQLTLVTVPPGPTPTPPGPVGPPAGSTQPGLDWNDPRPTMVMGTVESRTTTPPAGFSGTVELAIGITGLPPANFIALTINGVIAGPFLGPNGSVSSRGPANPGDAILNQVADAGWPSFTVTISGWEDSTMQRSMPVNADLKLYHNP
jgi:hypothetical protein